MHAGTSLPAWRQPFEAAFFLTCRVPHLGLWQHNITVVHETTRHALTAARVALDHDKARLKDSHGDYGHRQFLMVGLIQQQHTVTLATLLVGHCRSHNRLLEALSVRDEKGIRHAHHGAQALTSPLRPATVAIRIRSVAVRGLLLAQRHEMTCDNGIPNTRPQEHLLSI